MKIYGFRISLELYMWMKWPILSGNVLRGNSLEAWFEGSIAMPPKEMCLDRLQQGKVDC